ncbi:hypothetical protein HK102_010230, partial [Quaeritorhiza haematococci]
NHKETERSANRHHIVVSMQPTITLTPLALITIFSFTVSVLSAPTNTSNLVNLTPRSLWNSGAWVHTTPTKDSYFHEFSNRDEDCLWECLGLATKYMLMHIPGCDVSIFEALDYDYETSGSEGELFEREGEDGEEGEEEEKEGGGGGGDSDPIFHCRVEMFTVARECAGISVFGR